jgi:hypothetical protein
LEGVDGVVARVAPDLVARAGHDRVVAGAAEDGAVGSRVLGGVGAVEEDEATGGERVADVVGAVVVDDRGGAGRTAVAREAAERQLHLPADDDYIAPSWER